MFKKLVFALLLSLLFCTQTLAQNNNLAERTLLRALSYGDADAMETWVAQNQSSLNQSFALRNGTSLHPATIVLLYPPRAKKIPLLRKMVSLGTHFNYIEPALKGQTPLHILFSHAPADEIESLLQFLMFHRAEASVHVKDKNGKTPIDLALDKGYTFAHQYLLTFKPSRMSNMSVAYIPMAYQKGAQALKEYEKEERLIEAVVQEDLTTIKQLLKQGASPEAKDLLGNRGSSLHLATLSSNRELFDMLLQVSQRLDQRDRNGDSALHLAAQQGNLYRIRKLVKAGAQVAWKNHASQTPLMQLPSNAPAEAKELLTLKAFQF